MFAREARQHRLKSAADGVSRHEHHPHKLRCLMCRAATAPRAAQHVTMISRLCACVWLAGSTEIVMLIMCSAVFFMIKHRSRLLRFAEANMTYSLPRVCGRACMASLARRSEAARSGMGRAGPWVLHGCVRGLLTGLLLPGGCKCV